MLKKGKFSYVWGYICNRFYINVLSLDGKLNIAKSTVEVKNAWPYTFIPP
jgi:hypothetical protein